MSYQQAFDTVDTPARNRQNWPSPDAFHYPAAVLKWRDISTGVFKILDKFERGENQNGRGLVLKLEHCSGPIVYAWAPVNLVLALKQEKDARFVQKLGLKNTGYGHQYFEFKLC